ncbi:MAG TPA: hypothetical protein VF796_30630 [Humisphaera sp.]
MANGEETSGTERPPLLVRLGRRVVRAGLFVALASTAVVGFGISPETQGKFSSFTAASQRWQQNPEFRTVARQYTTGGSDAMRTRPFGITAANWIVAIRSIPGLPPEFAVNDTSRTHYANFSRGPLSAYLHLCFEQDLTDAAGNGYYLHEMEELARDGVPDEDPTDPRYQRIVYWLTTKMRVNDQPIAHDAGAIKSLLAVLRDTQPTNRTSFSAGVLRTAAVAALMDRDPAFRSLADNRFKWRKPHANVDLRAHASALAKELKLPEDVDEMTPEQQAVVFERLDGYVKLKDPELWRAKQVSDFLGGIWAQVYGPPYGIILNPFVTAVTVCRYVFVLLLAGLLLSEYRRARAAEAAGQEGTADGDDGATGVVATPA